MNIELQKYPDLNYSLVFRPNAVDKFVCAYMPEYDESGNLLQWSQGHYFYSLEDAISYMNNLTIDLLKANGKVSTYQQYKNLSDEDKKNLRIYSCFRAVDDTLKHNIENREDLIEQIASISYVNWVLDDRDLLSCEDISIFLASGFNYYKLDINKLKQLNPAKFVDIVDSQNFDDFELDTSNNDMFLDYAKEVSI